MESEDMQMPDLFSGERDQQRHELRTRLRGFAIKPWEMNISGHGLAHIESGLVARYLRLGKLWRKGRRFKLAPANVVVDKLDN